MQAYVTKMAQLGITPAEAIALPDADLEAKLMPPRQVRLGYETPKYEAIYPFYISRGKNRKTLKQCWEGYKNTVSADKRAISYPAFCKGFSQFCQDLPVSCRDLSLTNQWLPGQVVMIDYSGDGLPLYKKGSGESTTAQLFVGVLACSGYIFATLTPRQTAEDWLDAQIEMLDAIGGVPEEIWLDNSTSLVLKADKYRPVFRQEYVHFCDHYNTLPVAVRPGMPRDKALVENAVKQCQRFILARLKEQRFEDIGVANTAVRALLEELNNRPLTGFEQSITRRQQYLDELPALKPLPLVPYDKSAIYKVFKVQKNYLVRYKDARYSVPCDYVGKKVSVVIRPTAQTLQVFDILTGKQIAEHYLTDQIGGKSIRPEHMPPAHRAVSLTIGELLGRLRGAGPDIGALADRVSTENHGERARKTLRAMDSWCRQIGSGDFNKLCKAAMEAKTHCFLELEKQMNRYVGEQPTEASTKRDSSSTELKASVVNVRGADYFKKRFSNK